MSETAQPSGRGTIRRLALARAISGSGSTAAYVALSYAVYQRTHSAAWVSVSILATFGVSGFVAPLSGWIGDRFDRRRVMIASDLAAAALSLAVAASTGSVALMVVITLAVSLAEAPFFAASSAAVPNLVRADELPWANSLLAGSRSVGILAGPIVGGVMVAGFGAGGAFLANAASFLSSAALAFSASGRFSAERHERQRSALSLSAGYRWLWRDAVARVVTPAMTLLFLGMGLGMTADAPLIARLHAGPLSYALLVTAWGAGEIAGSVVFPRVAWRLTTTLAEVRALGAALLGVAFGFGGIVAWPHLWFVICVTLAGGFSAAPTFALRQGLVQRRTPDAVRSRAIAAVEGLTDLGQLVGLVAAGAVIGAAGPLAAYAASGLAMVCAAGLVLGTAATRSFAAASEHEPQLPQPVATARFPHVAAEQAEPL